MRARDQHGSSTEKWLKTLTIKTINSPNSRIPKPHRNEKILNDLFVCFDGDLIQFKFLYTPIVKKLPTEKTRNINHQCVCAFQLQVYEVNIALQTLSGAALSFRNKQILHSKWVPATRKGEISLSKPEAITLTHRILCQIFFYFKFQGCCSQWDPQTMGLSLDTTLVDFHMSEFERATTSSSAILHKFIWIWEWSATHQPSDRRRPSTLEGSQHPLLLLRKQSANGSSWKRKDQFSYMSVWFLWQRGDRYLLPCKCLIKDRHRRIYSPNRQDRYSVRLSSWEVRRTNCSYYSPEPE